METQEPIPQPQAAEVPVTKEELAEAFALQQFHRTHPSFRAARLGFIGGYESRDQDVADLKLQIKGLMESVATISEESQKEIASLEEKLAHATEATQLIFGLNTTAYKTLDLYSRINKGFSWGRLWASIRGQDMGVMARQTAKQMEDAVDLKVMERGGKSFNVAVADGAESDS